MLIPKVNPISYWQSLIVFNPDGRAMRKLSIDEAIALYPDKNPLTLDRDVRRAWAKFTPKEEDTRFRTNSVLYKPKDVLWHRGAIDLNRSKETKFVVLFDSHFPYQCHQPAVERFLKDYQPDRLIYGGDMMNMDPFNHWIENTPRESRNMPLPKAHYDRANEEFFLPLRKAAPKAEITYMYGNHEFWAKRAIDDDPRGEGYWEPELNVTGVDQWVKERELINIGKLYIMHGDQVGNSPGVNPARNLFMRGYHRNIIAGHLHTYNVATEVSPIDIEDRHVAEFSPCLTAYNPPFMNNRPHQWVQGFVVGVVEPSGVFHKQTVVITNGSFYVNGQRY